MRLPILLPSLALAGLAVAALQIDWSTLDSGGGSSAGGGYVLQGTVGQPDAATMTGGTYLLTGGYWAIPEVVPVPGGPELVIQGGPGTTQLLWPAPSPGWRLESSVNMQSWTAVPTVPAVVAGLNVVPFNPAPGSPKQFFRLKFP